MKIKFFDLQSVFFRNAIRATLAVAISLLIAHGLSTQRSYWIPMSTIVLMQMSLGASIKRTKQRVVGTLLGVLFGVMLSTLFRHYAVGMLVSLPLLLMLAIYCIPFSYAVFIFFASMAIIMLLSFHSVHPWEFAFARIIDTLMGASVALVVSLFFFPKWAREDFYVGLLRGLEACHDFFAELIEGLLNQQNNMSYAISQIIAIEDLLVQIRNNLDDYVHEPHSMIIADGSAYSIVIAEERMHSVLASLQVISNDRHRIVLDDALQKPLQQFFLRTQQLTQQLIHGISRRTKIPEFESLNDLFYEFKDRVAEREGEAGQEVLVLLYRNLFAYMSELKHMAHAANQLRMKVRRCYE